jgi:hypothetical protein
VPAADRGRCGFFVVHACRDRGELHDVRCAKCDIANAAQFALNLSSLQQCERIAECLSEDAVFDK